MPCDRARKTYFGEEDMRNAVIAALAGCVLFAGTVGQAQQPAPPANPLDVVPDQMPFDVPYGAPIALDRAKEVAAAAEAEAKKHNWKMNIAVVDSGGNLVAFERMDSAQLASIAISQHKAHAALIYRRETKIFENGVNGSSPYLATLDGVIASRGGVLLIEGGKIIGAIGVSGGTGSQDEVVSKAGAALIK
jgi:glc operon protein GlcG